MNAGDPSIYLTFAKSMRKGFFYYGNEGPKGGATSPLWALLLAFFYLFGEPDILLIKYFNLILLILSIALLFVLTKRVSNDIISAFFAVFLYASYDVIQSTTALFFETTLASLFVFLSILLTIRLTERLNLATTIAFKDWLVWSIVLGILPLTRPECIMITFLCIFSLGFLLIKKKIKAKILLFSIFSFLAVLISSGWYIYMWQATGQLVPSSISARAIEISNLKGVSIWQTLFRTSILRLSVYLSAIMFLVGFIFLLVNPKTNKTSVSLIVLSILSFVVLFSFKNPGQYMPRYLIPVKGLLFLLMGTGIGYLLRHFVRVEGKQYWASLVLFLCMFKAGVEYGKREYIYAYTDKITKNFTMEQILEKPVALFLNSKANEKDYILVYEMQTQYYLKPQAISLDGIVGGEIIPYLKSKSDLTDFLLKYKPKFIIVSNALEYRKEFANTILNKLYRQDNQIRINSSIEINGILFTKVFERTLDQVPFDGACKSIYKITYNEIL